MIEDIKIYEAEGFRLEFITDGSPFEGILYTSYPEHEPHGDSVSLAKPRSRKAYAKAAAKHTGVDQVLLERVLTDLGAIRFEEDDAAHFDPEVGQEEIDAVVGKPGVLKRVVEAAAAYSKVVGEKYVLALLFLVFLSAQLEPLPGGKPLVTNLILSAPPGRGKNYLADAVARLLPGEFYYTFEASSPKSLYYKAKVEGPACLKHRGSSIPTRPRPSTLWSRRSGPCSPLTGPTRHRRQVRGRGERRPRDRA